MDRLSDELLTDEATNGIDTFGEFCGANHQVAPWFSIGKSSKWQAMLKMANRFANARLPILVVGEYGSGKRDLTQHIVNQRSQTETVRIACRELRYQLLPGHGSFVREWHRFVRQLDSFGSATWIIQGIEEIPFELQSPFVDLISRSQAAGCQRSALIATSRIAPLKMLEEGRLREDFYHLIAAIEFVVPPLRERDDDIPILATHFASNAHSKQTRMIRLQPNAMEMLCDYDWPGNVIELRNIISRVRAYAEHPSVDADTLRHIWNPPGSQHPAEFTSLNLENAETQLILQAVERSSGNKTLAAKKLGISARTLHNKIRKFRMMGLMPSD